jgi:hypothetical protein
MGIIVARSDPGRCLLTAVDAGALSQCKVKMSAA